MVEPDAPIAVARGRSLTARIRSRRFVARYAIPLEWWLMAPAMLMAVVIHGWASWSLPPVASGLMTLVAALIAAATPLAVRFERHRRSLAAERWMVVGGVVMLPMFLFGAAMSGSVKRPGFSGGGFI